MKLRILFLKKKNIYYAILGIVLLVLLIILLTTRKSSPTFDITDNSKVKKIDLTGDGKEDLLYIKFENDKYLVEINTNNKSLTLEPDKKLNSLGSYYSYWPMRATILDITRDKIPEIMLQSSYKNSPIQHIFKWNGEAFTDMFCAPNNLLGFLDSGNSKTPKMVSGNVTRNTINLSYYYYSNQSLQSFTYNNKENFIGKNTILSFVNYIQGLPNSEPNKPKDIFYSGLSGKDISIIGKLSGENNTYALQDGFFKDTKWDKNGNPLEIKWALNFKAVSNLQKDQIKNYNINLILKPDENCDGHDGCFKIYSISLE